MRATFPGTSARRITGSPFPKLWAMCEREKTNARDIVRAQSYGARSGFDYREAIPTPRWRIARPELTTMVDVD